VAGYTVFNDVSARDLQFATSQWTMGKALDTFAPMGPGLIPASAVPNPQKLELKTWVNGELLQSGSTANMIFSVAQIIEFLSRYMTLVPGDIIATGTPAGVGFTRKPPRFINSGDLVETEITSLGRLRNPAMRR
jgi:2-keto-4-pentenoate hydratase/2-oxohepta-3-ene-1,7-dioic acid hydratase in catechol pathway